MIFPKNWLKENQRKQNIYHAAVQHSIWYRSPLSILIVQVLCHNMNMCLLLNLLSALHSETDFRSVVKLEKPVSVQWRKLNLKKENYWKALLTFFGWHRSPCTAPSPFSSLKDDGTQENTCDGADEAKQDVNGSDGTRVSCTPPNRQPEFFRIRRASAAAARWLQRSSYNENLENIFFLISVLGKVSLPIEHKTCSWHHDMEMY